MFDFDSYIRLLREDPKTIVLPEGTDPRVIPMKKWMRWWNNFVRYGQRRA